MFHIEVPVGPHWQHIELLRTSVLNCLSTVFQNQDYCHALSMVAGELLENAVKYGDWSRTDHKCFRLRVEGGAREVRVEVSNPVVPGSVEVSSVLETIKRISNAGSPSEAYMQRLCQIAEQQSAETSGLGLVRIAYEADCSLAAMIDDNNILRVEAVTNT